MTLVGHCNTSSQPMSGLLTFISLDCDFSIFPEPHLEHAISLDPTNFNLQLQWQGNVGQDMTLSSMDCESVSLLDDDIQISPTVPDLPNSTGTKIALATQSNAGTEPEPSRTSFSSLERTSVTYMDKLLALQSKLHTLSGFFSKVGTQNLESEESSASTGVASRDIEETFTATENLVDIIHNLHGTMPFKRPQEPAVCHSMDKRNDSNHEMPSTASGLSDSSTVLLTLSCYLRLLQVYELLVASLHSNVQQSTHDTSRFSTLGASPASSANSSALNAPPVGIPILNIGHFNLATSPDMNIGLMLHFVLEMVERLQTAVQLCAFTAQSSMEGLASSGRRSSTARYTHPAFLNRGGDEVHSSSTVSAVQGVFGAMVSDVGVREEELTQTLYEAKKLLRGKSVSRSRYH